MLSNRPVLFGSSSPGLQSKSSPAAKRQGSFVCGGGDGSRTIKFDIATSKIGGVMALSLCICACCATCKISTCARVQKIVLPEMLPKSALRFLKSCCCCGCQIFTLPLQFMPVYTGCVHVLAMAHEHLQLAVSQDAGFNTDKGVPQLVK